jgi:ABC-type sugar transport system ATPase subunit
MSSVHIKDLTKKYPNAEVNALQQISFDVQDGEFFCVLGPAGAGKTTLIKVIAGIEPANSGNILIEQADVTDLLPADRDVAVAFETYALYPQKTVRENMAFPLNAPIRRAEMTREAIETRVAGIADLLGIGELLDRFPRQLSGGQRQRVALGRALVRKPKVYLLDEPIAHLDAKLRHRMRAELKRIQMELGVTTIYTTPDQLEALSLADRMVVLNNGRIEQAGTPDEVYKRPVNTFVARFVGDPPMNLLEASYSDNHIVIKGLGSVEVDDRMASLSTQIPNGKSFLVGIRPKDIVLEPGEAAGIASKGIVKHVQILGETSIVSLKTDHLDLRAKMATQNAPASGAVVGVRFNPADFHYFDAGTNLRITSLDQ